MDIHLFRNQLDFATLREVEKGGATFIVVNGVPIVEGVLNRFLVPYEEFGAFPADWNDMPLVLNHPQQNGGSARVANPDVPVIGRFLNSTLDSTGKRLTGEFWLDKMAFLATDEGKALYTQMLEGKPVEVSTGYFAPKTIFESGKFNGTEYMGIHKGIHPDHIAILTNELGACSLRDGCGMNRNSMDVILNCGNAATCTRPDCPLKKKKKEDEVSTNADEVQASFENSAMVALMIPDTLKADLQKAYPFMDDATRDALHITIVYLGDNRTLNNEAVMKALFSSASSFPAIKGKMQGVARFVGEGDTDPIVITFDSPQMLRLYAEVCSSLNRKSVPYHKNHSFIPHMTIGYVKKGEPMPVQTIEPMEINFSELTFVSGTTSMPATLEGWTGDSSAYINSVKFTKQSANSLRDWFANQSLFPKEFLMQNASLKAFLHALGFKDVSIEDKGEAGLSLSLTGSGDDKALEGLMALNSVVQNSGGAQSFIQTFDSLKGLPAALAAMQTQLNENLALIQNAATFAQSVADKEATQKSTVIAGLVQNKACPFDQPTLEAMTLPVLEKLSASYQPVDFRGLGAGFAVQNSGVEYKPLTMPKMLLAEQKEA